MLLANFFSELELKKNSHSINFLIFSNVTEKAVMHCSDDYRKDILTILFKTSSNHELKNIKKKLIFKKEWEYYE